jgi:hypothetical protein
MKIYKQLFFEDGKDEKKSPKRGNTVIHSKCVRKINKFYYCALSNIKLALNFIHICCDI